MYLPDKCEILALQPIGIGQLLTFGYELPYLPDFLADHTLLGEKPSERISEFFSRWTQFVGWLWKWRGSAFSLRFLSDPLRGQINISLLGRILINAEIAQGNAYASEAAADLSRLMTAFGLPHQALTQTGLRYHLQPFPEYSLNEIRQHEENMNFPLVGNKKGYVVHPYLSPSGSMLSPFETMLRQSSPCVVSLYLEPTEISTDEHTALELAAVKAESLKEHHLTADYMPVEMGQMRIADPQIALAARIYASFLKRLVEPFIVLAQVASPQRTTTATVARAFGRAFVHDRTEEQNPSAESLPTAVDIVAPMDTISDRQARRAFETLIYEPWGSTQAVNSPGLQRLRFLADARGAAVVWRLPVNVRGGIPGIEVRQPPPDFEPGPRPTKLGHDEIQIGILRRGGLVAAELNAFTRHGLVTGFTGSGKTNTVLFILDQLWDQHKIPFLVIEAAKKEYRGFSKLKGYSDLLVFTLGDETTSPFRLNPFELLPGVRLEAHLGRLQTCFDAALPQFGILPSIIAESMEEIYQREGWKLTDTCRLGEERSFPNLSELLRAVMRVVEKRGYQGEVYHNIRAAAMGRIGSLLRGSKGRMFGTKYSISAELIFSRPVVLELNDLNEDDKALTMMFLLMWLREYRELHPTRHLQHVTVIEEAHNVVSNVHPSGNTEVAPDTKAKAVGAFANMLAEVRAYGEGILISDQSPEKLAPDAMRNTNLQIAHQLRDQRDREAISRAMIMDEEQRNYLGKLRTGQAALFQTGMEKATFITIPDFQMIHPEWEQPNDRFVHEKMMTSQQEYVITHLPHSGCKFCGSQCLHRDVIEPFTLDQELNKRFEQALLLFNTHPEDRYWHDHWRAIAQVCIDAGELAELPGVLDAAYCYLAQEIDFEFTEHMRHSFEIGFRELKGA